MSRRAPREASATSCSSETSIPSAIGWNASWHLVRIVRTWHTARGARQPVRSASRREGESAEEDERCPPPSRRAVTYISRPGDRSDSRGDDPKTPKWPEDPPAPQPGCVEAARTPLAASSQGRGGQNPPGRPDPGSRRGPETPWPPRPEVRGRPETLWPPRPEVGGGAPKPHGRLDPRSGGNSETPWPPRPEVSGHPRPLTSATPGLGAIRDPLAASPQSVGATRNPPAASPRGWVGTRNVPCRLAGTSSRRLRTFVCLPAHFQAVFRPPPASRAICAEPGTNQARPRAIAIRAQCPPLRRLRRKSSAAAPSNDAR